MQTAYRSTEPPRPTNLDVEYRASEGDDWAGYYCRRSTQESVGLAALCFVAMIVIALVGGVWSFVQWVLSSAP